jgi:hypothetical protein
MEKIREFNPTDRYIYDFDLCTTSKGYAQVDTEQDAHYYGTWANPFDLIVISYCEGDVCISKAANEQEFIDELNAIKQWNIDNGWRFKGIDPGFNEALKNRFIELGLSDLLY